MAGFPAEIARRLQRGFGVRQCIAHRLMFDDGFKPAAQLGFGEMQREIKRRPHQAHAHDPDQRGGAGEARVDNAAPRAGFAQHVVVGHAHVVQFKHGGRMRAIAHGVDQFHQSETTLGLRHRNHRDTPLRRRRWVAATYHAEQVRALAVPARAVHPFLGAVNHPLVAFEPGAGAHAGGRGGRRVVGAATRFAIGERRKRRTGFAEKGRDEFLLLRGRAGEKHRHQAEQGGEQGE